MADLLKQWGFSNGFAVPTTTDFTELISIGCLWNRTDLNWWDVEPTQTGGFTGWSRGDQVMSACISSGAKWCCMINSAPPWARPAGSSFGFPTPTFYQRFADFCAAAVTRYAAQGVTHFEIWNEQNYASNLGLSTCDATDYVNAMKLVYPAMKNAAAAIGKSIIVMTGGVAPASSYTDSAHFNGTSQVNPVRWLEAAYAAGLSPVCDAIGYHPYPNDSQAGSCTTFNVASAWSQISETSPSMRSLMVANGDTTKLMHATETGLRSSMSSQQGQADGLVACTNSWASRSYTGMYLWFCENERMFSSDPTYGLRTSTDVAKIAWGTYQTQIAALGTGGAGGGGGGGGTTGQTFTQWIQSLTGLQAFWKAGDSASPLAPSTGAISLPSTGTGHTFGVTGLTGDTSEKAVRVNGSGFFQDGDNFDFPVKAPFTIGMLFKPSAIDLNAFHMLVAKRDVSPNPTVGYMGWLNNNAGTPRLSNERDGDTIVQSAVNTNPAGLAVGTTALIIFSYDGATLNTYCNNVKASSPGTDTVADNAGLFQWLGGGNGVPAKGDASHLFILNRVITDTEVASGVTAITVAPSGGGGTGGTGNLFSDIVLSTSPASYWKLGETTGTFADSVGTNTLTLSGSLTSRGSTGLTGDTTNKAVVFGGAGTLQDGDIFDFATGAAFSWMALVNPSELNTGLFYGLVSKFVSGAGWQVWLNNNAGAMRCGFELDAATSNGNSLTTTDIAVGQRVLLVGTYDGSTTSILYSNNATHSQAAAISLGNNAANFTLGGGGNMTSFKGTMDDFAIWNRVLSQTEVNSMIAALDNTGSVKPHKRKFRGNGRL